MSTKDGGFLWVTIIFLLNKSLVALDLANMAKI